VFYQGEQEDGVIDNEYGPDSEARNSYWTQVRTSANSDSPTCWLPLRKDLVRISTFPGLAVRCQTSEHVIKVFVDNKNPDTDQITARYIVWDKAKSLEKPSLRLGRSNFSLKLSANNEIVKYLFFNGNTVYVLSQNFTGKHIDSYTWITVSRNDKVVYDSACFPF
jgi:hypothetical protein